MVVYDCFGRSIHLAWPCVCLVFYTDIVFWIDDNVHGIFSLFGKLYRQASLENVLQNVLAERVTVNFFFDVGGETRRGSFIIAIRFLRSMMASL